MATRSEKEKKNQVQEKCQAILNQLLRDEDNKYCVDCDAKGPRWASWNLGIFLCIRCAGIHRNLGVHISRVKSVNLDTWTPEQVACLQQMGNSRARAVYEANLPDNFRRPQTDSSLEAFVRAKYEQKKYIAKEWVPPPLPKPTFEIEDNTKKSSSEKKSRPKGSGIDLSIPGPIPAPVAKSSTPTSSASSTPPPVLASQQKKAESKTSAAVDLLGLDDVSSSSQPSVDLFGSFLSATSVTDTSDSIDNIPTKTTVASISETTTNNEEANLFKVTSSSTEEKKKQLTKESILSLYSQSSATPTQPQIFNIPAGGGGGGGGTGLYMGQPQAFSNPSVPINYAAAPGMGMMPTAMMGSATPVNMMSNIQPMASQQHVFINSSNLTGTNPFLNPAGVAAMYPTNMNSQPSGIGQFGNCMQQNVAYGSNTKDLMWDVSLQGGICMNSASNPFASQLIQLPQQMANMSVSSIGSLSQPPIGLNHSTSSWSPQNPGQTLSTNLWQ